MRGQESGLPQAQGCFLERLTVDASGQAAEAGAVGAE